MLPTCVAMILFIAIPIVSIFVQSLFIEHQKELIQIERCDPFGCETEVGVDIEAFAALNKEKPLGRFNGFKTYTDRNHLAFNELSEGWKNSKTFPMFMVHHKLLICFMLRIEIADSDVLKEIFFIMH